MALTPEDVVNKRFQNTKFREGYDQDEVDDFLDEVVLELRRLITENDDLRQKLAVAEARLTGEEVAVPVVAKPVTPAAPVPAPALPFSSTDDAAASASANDMLTLARRLHDEHVREGIEKRDALIAEGHDTARRLVAEAEFSARDTLRELEKEKVRLQGRINELSQFEGEYRTKLRTYMTDQLAELEALGGTKPFTDESSAQ
jgi:cell division initiation protein